MIQAIKYKVAGLLKRDDQRSQKIVKNVILSFGVKGGSILIGLLLVPMTISYINPIQYGVWLTVSSLVSWMSFFDIGLGNGLRNKLATALARKEYKQARAYVSTTYVFLAIISLLLFTSFALINQFIDWRSVLNIPGSIGDNIHLVLLIVFASFCIQFVVQLLNTVLTAVHEPGLAGIINFIGQVIVLIAIFILSKCVQGNLKILVTVITVIPIIVGIASSILLYNGNLKFLAPSISMFKWNTIKSIFNVGGAFFLIQLGSIVLIQTDNIIIARFIGPASVTVFNVAFKLFSIVIMLFSIVMVPYWSAFTDAYTRKDYSWMRSSVNKIRRIWLLISLIIVPVLLISSGYIFNIWVGRTVNIPMSLSIWLGLYVINYTCLNLNSYFLNGVGKIRLQLFLYILVCLVNIPLSCIFAKKYGLNGVVISNLIMMVIMNVVLWIQSNKILEKKDQGLWAQ